ncbi:hypothetical protein L7F22_052458 [Adiantum nelumboides]|nr:hypothetical protein [Adiantum nelumboides]
MKHLPTRIEETYAYKHGLTPLLCKLQDEGESIDWESVSIIENLDKVEELKEEPIDLALEEKESANLDGTLFRAETIVDEPTKDVPVTETSLTLVHLPSFYLNGKDYITLHSIQSLFNIRDYCLAAIAEASQVAKDFVDIEGESKEEFLAPDLQTSNEKFLEALDAFEFCLKRVVEEEPALKDADFEARLVELGIDKFGRNVLKPHKINADLGAKINLEHEGQIEADVLQKTELLDEDNFLGRAGGLRVTSKYTGHALIHYLPKLDKDIFYALHSQYSDHPELPMFAIKTLSRFMGFLPLPNNVNRILLLERAVAFTIFGYAPGFHGSGAGYFLCYSSNVISNKDTNVKLLVEYKRRKFLRDSITQLEPLNVVNLIGLDEDVQYEIVIRESSGKLTDLRPIKSKIDDAKNVIAQDEVLKAAKCGFLYRMHALQDCQDSSKGFFKKLQSKRKREVMHCLQLEDGTEVTEHCQIMCECENFYTALLAGDHGGYAPRAVAMIELLETVDTCIEQSEAGRVEAPFEAKDERAEDVQRPNKDIKGATMEAERPMEEKKTEDEASKPMEEAQKPMEETMEEKPIDDEASKPMEEAQKPMEENPIDAEASTPIEEAQKPMEETRNEDEPNKTKEGIDGMAGTTDNEQHEIEHGYKSDKNRARREM